MGHDWQKIYFSRYFLTSLAICASNSFVVVKDPLGGVGGGPPPAGFSKEILSSKKSKVSSDSLKPLEELIATRDLYPVPIPIHNSTLI